MSTDDRLEKLESELRGLKQGLGEFASHSRIFSDTLSGKDRICTAAMALLIESHPDPQEENLALVEANIEAEPNSGFRLEGSRTAKSYLLKALDLALERFHSKHHPH
jgi:hypothetical protein